MSQSKIAVIAHRQKPQALRLLREVEAWAKKRGHEIVTNVEAGRTEFTGSAVRILSDAEVCSLFQGARWAVTLGGDGTILYAAHLVAPLGIPILAVQLGDLGFHTQVEPDALTAALDCLDRNEFRTEDRMALAVDVESKQESDGPPLVRGALALNDVVVSKSSWGRMVHLRLAVDGKPASDLYADGLLVATPTGSSAYNYAARGPVLEPSLEAIILNAICPHRLNFSPIVLSSEHEIAVEFHPQKQREEAQLLVDGRPCCHVDERHRLKIYKAPVYVRLIVFEDRFFEKLRDKLAWGGLFWKTGQ